MIVSIHQPAYLPWLGYFDKIKKSDVFVFLDTVQFEKNSFINRNKLKNNQGEFWLTVPVLTKGHTHSTIAETKIDNKQPWMKKHLKSIEQNYSKAKNFEICFEKLKKLYSKNHEYLSDLCWHQLQFWLEEFNIKTEIIFSKKLDITSEKSDLVLDICKKLKADTYISGVLGKNYLDLDKFKDNQIDVTFQDYQHPSYSQLYGNFISHLGIIDFWMNSGETNLI